MWKYWVLADGSARSEIDAMQAEVAAGTLHPMEAEEAAGADDYGGVSRRGGGAERR